MSEIPPNDGRLIAIGDIHGYSKYLNAILAEINPTEEDAFVFLGDFIDRGPDSKGVIDAVLELSKKCKVYSILGNHEEMVLMCIMGGKDDHKFWCKVGGKEALDSYGVEKAVDMPREHLLFISNCADFYENDKFIFVHASCSSCMPLDKNGGDVLRWLKLDDDPKPHFSGKTVICGHTAQKKVLDLGFLICIDTGCGIWPGGRLTALDVKSGTTWQMGGQAKKVKVTKLREMQE